MASRRLLPPALRTPSTPAGRYDARNRNLGTGPPSDGWSWLRPTSQERDARATARRREALRDDAERARRHRETRLGDIADVVAVDLERDGPAVERAHDRLLLAGP